MSDTKYMTTQEAADYLGLSDTTLYSRMSKGILTPTARVGRMCAFSKEDLDEHKASYVPNKPGRPRNIGGDKSTMAHFTIDVDSKEALCSIAESRGVSTSALIRGIVLRFLTTEAGGKAQP